MEHLQEALDSSDFFAKLTAALESFPFDKLVNPTLNLQALILEGNSADGDSSGTFDTNEHLPLQSGHLLISVRALINNHRMRYQSGMSSC